MPEDNYYGMRIDTLEKLKELNAPFIDGQVVILFQDMISMMVFVIKIKDRREEI